jgi:hypothetical protein
MAFTAMCSSLVSHLDRPPLGLIGFPVQSIHVPPLPDTKISRYQHRSGDQNYPDNYHHNQQWPPHMIFQSVYLCISDEFKTSAPVITNPVLFLHPGGARKY